MFTPLSYVKQNPWDADPDAILWLLTPAELDAVPADTILTSINGYEQEAGQIDDRDTRFGYTAYGLLEHQFVTALEGYEPAENSYAKDHVIDALERELHKQGIDPYPEGDIQGGSIELIDLADAVVERLLKEGVIIPEDIRDPQAG